MRATYKKNNCIKTEVRIVISLIEFMTALIQLPIILTD